MPSKSNTISSILKPTPCSFVWKETLLTKSYLSSRSTYDLSLDTTLENALAKLSKDDDFMSHLKLLEASKTAFNKTLSQETFLKTLGYVNLDLINKIIIFMTELPEEFKDWALNKKLGPKDFRAFMNDYTLKEDRSAFVKIADLNPTKSNGINILEYYFDLKAVKKIKPSFLSDFKTPDKLLSSLKKKRFSNTLSSDQIVSDKLSKLDLSKGVKIELKRLGDQKLIKLEINSSSPEQLVAHLSKTSQKIEEISKAWNSNDKGSKS